MAITTTIASSINTVETLADGSIGSNNTVTHTGYDESNALNGGTTPPATVCAFFLGALAAGAKTIDLTALSGTNGATVSGTGLKVQAFRVKNLGANAMTFTVGASNGYELAGAGWKLILASGQYAMIYGNDATPDVAAGAKTIDVSGTGTQTFECSIILG